MRTNYADEYQELVKLISNQVDDLIIREEKLTLVVPDVYFINERT